MRPFRDSVIVRHNMHLHQNFLQAHSHTYVRLSNRIRKKVPQISTDELQRGLPCRHILLQCAITLNQILSIARDPNRLDSWKSRP